jgi:hypothetical protein
MKSGLPPTPCIYLTYPHQHPLNPFLRATIYLYRRHLTTTLTLNIITIIIIPIPIFTFSINISNNNNSRNIIIINARTRAALYPGFKN